MEEESKNTAQIPKETNDSDSEYEYEEETVYVVADLGKDALGFVNRMSSSDMVSLAGVDTDTPFLQLGGITFQGYHDESLGSQLVFEPQINDDDEEKQPAAKLIANTTRVIHFDQVELIQTESRGPANSNPPPN